MNSKQRRKAWRKRNRDVVAKIAEHIERHRLAALKYAQGPDNHSEHVAAYVANAEFL